MQNRHNFNQWCLELFTSVALIGVLMPPITNAAEEKSTADIITSLVEADEFKAREREQLKALPIESVPMLTTILIKTLPGQSDLRHFGLLAMKVRQFESKLKTQPLDNAINALLTQIDTLGEITENEAATLRIKLQALSAIRDQRIIEAVRLAHTALKADKEMPTPRSEKEGEVRDSSSDKKSRQEPESRHKLEDHRSSGIQKKEEKTNSASDIKKKSSLTWFFLTGGLALLVVVAFLFKAHCAK